MKHRYLLFFRFSLILEISMTFLFLRDFSNYMWTLFTAKQNSLQIFCPFLIELFLYSTVLRVLFEFWKQVPIRCVFCKYFLPVYGWPFHSFNSVICRTEVFSFNEVSLKFFVSWVMLLVYLKTHCQTQVT